MTNVTQLIQQLEKGDGSAQEQLLLAVYEELRRLAAAKLASEKLGQTLQATALVHEAYMRLVDVTQPVQWHGRAHFFGAAAEDDWRFSKAWLKRFLSRRTMEPPTDS